MLRKILRALAFRRTKGPSQARLESNRWLHRNCAEVEGKVLSIGSGDDSDGEGRRYRDYFRCAETYLSSECAPTPGCDLVLDVRSMPEIPSASIDCVYCSGVLEHVDDLPAALAEIARVLADGGLLLLGVPFRQAIHLAPTDYWRFTRHGIEYMLARDYEILEVFEIEPLRGADFPSAYWVKAIRRHHP